jgi:hypothetical protein
MRKNRSLRIIASIAVASCAIVIAHWLSDDPISKAAGIVLLLGGVLAKWIEGHE